MIATYLNDSHGNWDVHIQKFALVLRSMINETTGASPALLNLGREIMLPIDRSLQTEECQNYELEARKLAESLPLGLKEIIKVARSNIIRAHQVNKVYFDAKRRDVNFNIGEKVWVRNHELSDADQNKAKKFCKKWIGPYKILKRHEYTYVLDMPHKMIPKRHVSDLKPFYERKINVETPISIREIQTGEEPKIPIARQLRAKNRVDFKKASGIRNYTKID